MSSVKRQGLNEMTDRLQWEQSPSREVEPTRWRADAEKAFLSLRGYTVFSAREIILTKISEAWKRGLKVIVFETGVGNERSRSGLRFALLEELGAEPFNALSDFAREALRSILDEGALRDIERDPPLFSRPPPHIDRVDDGGDSVVVYLKPNLRPNPSVSWSPIPLPEY